MVVNVLHLWKVEVKLLVENSDKWCCPAEKASRSELPMTQFNDVPACFKKKKITYSAEMYIIFLNDSAGTLIY